MKIEDLSYQVRGAIFEVFIELGPGLFESVYESALKYELENNDLIVQAQLAVPVLYKKDKA